MLHIELCSEVIIDAIKTYNFNFLSSWNRLLKRLLPMNPTVSVTSAVFHYTVPYIIYCYLVVQPWESSPSTSMCGMLAPPRVAATLTAESMTGKIVLYNL